MIYTQKRAKKRPSFRTGAFQLLSYIPYSASASALAAAIAFS